MLNNSFVEHFSDSIGIRSRPISTADGLQGSPDDDGIGTAGPASDGQLEPPRSPFSPGSSWSDRTVWRQWFDGMTNDLGEDDEDDLLESDEDDDGSQSSSSWSDDEPPSDYFDDATSSVTEASLSALYKCPVTVIPGFDIFDAIVLSQWDNVLGPQNKHVWTRRQQGAPNLYNKLLPFHPSCTLNGEISRENVGVETAEYKFCVLSEIGFAMGSFIFTSTVGNDGSLFAISLVLPIAQLQHYLAIQRLCINRMRHLINKLQVFLKVDKSKDDTILGFTGLLEPFLTSVKRIGIASTLSDPGHIQQTAFGTGSEATFHPNFLAAAITVHLESGGVSIVLGDEVGLVNRMIDTLALFLRDDECQRSRYADDMVELKYAPDLVVQGIITDQHGAGFDPVVLIQSSKPSTVIDVRKMTARHARRLDEHQVLHKESDKWELKDLEAQQLEAQAQAQQLSESPPKPITKPALATMATTFGKTAEFFGRPSSASEPAKNDSKAAPVRRRRLSLVTSTEPAVMVTSLLNKLTNPQYATGIRLAIIEHFSLKISRKANVMLQYMSALGADAFHPVPFEQQKAIQKNLELPTDPDFRIVLAAAERLQPGAYASMYGDPTMREESIVNLFSAF